MGFPKKIALVRNLGASLSVYSCKRLLEKAGKHSSLRFSLERQKNDSHFPSAGPGWPPFLDPYFLFQGVVLRRALGLQHGLTVSLDPLLLPWPKLCSTGAPWNLPKTLS